MLLLPGLIGGRQTRERWPALGLRSPFQGPLCKLATPSLQRPFSEE